MKTSFRTRIVVSTLLASAVSAAFAASPATQRSPLQVRLAPAADRDAAAAGVVEVTVTNTASHAVRVPTWQLASGDPTTSLFRVSHAGQPVRYTGMLAKRGAPRAHEFTVLQPGESHAALVDLAGSYAIEAPGDYTVAFVSRLHGAQQGSGETLRQANGLPVVAASDTLQLRIDLPVRHSPVPAAPVLMNVVNGVNYANCSASQVTALGSAMTQARNYAQNARNYLAANTTGPRYTTWFGAFNAARYDTVASNFVAIDDALDQNGGEITLNCDCTRDMFAYVITVEPYEIFLCNDFWAAPLTGTDSRAGTLVHEMSHFQVVADTSDNAYGQQDAKALANTEPDLAIATADNHEYFAENTPRQN